MSRSRFIVLPAPAPRPAPSRMFVNGPTSLSAGDNILIKAFYAFFSLLKPSTVGWSLGVDEFIDLYLMRCVKKFIPQFFCFNFTFSLRCLL
jgi:hypothetical protein